MFPLVKVSLLIRNHCEYFVSLNINLEFMGHIESRGHHAKNLLRGPPPCFQAWSMLLQNIKVISEFARQVDSNRKPNYIMGRGCFLAFT